MSSVLEVGLGLLEANETMRNRQSQPPIRWPEEPGVSWFRFILIWWGTEAAVRWFGLLAFPSAVRETIWVNLTLLFIAAPMAWLMTRQFAGAPLASAEALPTVPRARAIGEGIVFGAIALGAVFPLEWVDARLFGPQPPFLLGGEWTTLALLLAVNGVWSPIFEELAWRGRLQRSLSAAYGFGWGLAVTSTLFTFKHAVVDLSPGRLVTILGIGLCLGIAFRRGGLVAAVAAHVTLNLAASTIAWVMGG